MKNKRIKTFSNINELININLISFPFSCLSYMLFFRFYFLSIPVLTWLKTWAICARRRVLRALWYISSLYYHDYTEMYSIFDLILNFIFAEPPTPRILWKRKLDGSLLTEELLGNEPTSVGVFGPRALADAANLHISAASSKPRSRHDEYI